MRMTVEPEGADRQSGQSGQESPAGGVIEEGAVLAWSVHPAVVQRGRAVLVSVLIVAFSLLAALWMKGSYWGIFALVVLFLSLEAFYFRSDYRLDETGASVRRPFSRGQKPWDSIRCVIIDRFGITLSPFRRRHFLEAYRSVRLRFPLRSDQGPRPEEVVDFVVARVDPERTKVIDLRGSESSGPSDTREGGGS